MWIQRYVDIMDMCVHIYMCIYISTYMCMYMWIMDMYVHIDMCIYIHTHICVCICEFSGTLTFENLECIESIRDDISQKSIVVCCSVLQRVAACCSVLQCVRARLVFKFSKNLWSSVAVCCSVFHCVADCSGVVQCVRAPLLLTFFQKSTVGWCSNFIGNFDIWEFWILYRRWRARRLRLWCRKFACNSCNSSMSKRCETRLERVNRR